LSGGGAVETSNECAVSVRKTEHHANTNRSAAEIVIGAALSYLVLR